MRTLLAIALCFLCFGAAKAQQTDKFIFADTLAKNRHLSGNILLSKNGTIQCQKSFGYANIPFKVKNETDTRFKIASITKLFTAVLVMQLVEEKKLDLANSITTYLPDYKGPAGDSVTIKHLLTMTSGMRNMDEGISLDKAFAMEIDQYQKPHTSDEMLVKYSTDLLINRPGEKFDYNNAEYIVLGKIIEKVSGKSFEEQLKHKILEPLRMLNTGMVKQARITDKLAETYFDQNDTLVNDIPLFIENWYASGAMYSTIGDVHRFTNALFSGKLLHKSTLQQMFTSGPGEYGFGVWVYNNYDINGKMYTIVKRPGSILGAQAMIFHILEGDATIIVLANTSTVPMDEFAADLARYWLKQPNTKPGK